MTPYELSILLHYYGSAAKFRNRETELFKDTVQAWIDDGTLIFTETHNVFTLSDKARAWVKAILATPRPRRVYIDQNDEVIPL